MTKVKICGLSRFVDVDMVNETLPDYIGFVFAKSRRQIDEETAAQLKSKLNRNIQAVGVFVNEDKARIIRLCKAGTIDIVQLHGDEDEGYSKELRVEISNPIIKAVRVRNRKDIERAESFPCDYLLFDTYKESQYGGSGETFDWTMITKVNKPYFLAGGLQSDNVIQAINQAHPYCLDVSSGVETDGWKDNKKIIEIVTKIRSVR